MRVLGFWVFFTNQAGVIPDFALHLHVLPKKTCEIMLSNMCLVPKFFLDLQRLQIYGQIVFATEHSERHQ
jgi:hypothetical protein